MQEKKIVFWDKEWDSRLASIHMLYTYRELSEIFGVSTSTIVRAMKRLDLKHDNGRHENVPDGYKYCSSCKQILPRSSFYNNKSNKDGCSSYCKSCESMKASLKLAREKEDKRKEIEDKKLLQKYTQDNKNTTFYCERCNENKSIDDYYLYVYDGRVTKICKKCNKKNQISKKKKRKGRIDE